jgi:hypothetical protein
VVRLAVRGDRGVLFFFCHMQTIADTL